MMRSLLVGIAVALAPACQLDRTIGPEEPEKTVEQFTDLPVPRELTLQSGVNQSRSYHRGDYRTALFEYEGPITIDSARSFLLERLPAHGWELVQEDRPTRERMLQRWLSENRTGIQSLLVVELREQGTQTRMSYDLRSRRAYRAAEGTPDEASGSRPK